MIIVDSSVWIEAARRDGDIAVKVGLEGVLEEYEATLCGPVRLEVLGGAKRSARAVLEHYFQAIPYFPIRERHYDWAVRSSWKLRDAGLTVPWNDILIASFALEAGCRAYAKDKHFELMRPILGLKLYTPDYGGKFRPETG